jgi:hypothetical protein
MFFGGGGQGAFRLRHTPDLVAGRFAYASETDSQPRGCGSPAAFYLPMVGGELSSYGNIAGDSELDAHLTAAKNCSATLEGDGTITQAGLSLVVQLAAALAGVGAITQATLQSISSLSATITGSGTITQAQLGAIVQLTSALSGSGTISSANFTGLLSLSSSIEIAQTTGISVNDILSAEIETGYNMQEILRLVAAALAGKVSGGGTSTISIRDINDTVDRIVATVDSNGNRTAVTKDVT